MKKELIAFFDLQAILIKMNENNFDSITMIPPITNPINEKLQILDNPKSTVHTIYEAMRDLNNPEDVKRFPISALHFRTLIQRVAQEENLTCDRNYCEAFCLLTKVSKMTKTDEIRNAISKLRELLFTKQNLIKHEYKIGNLNYVV